MKRRSVPYRLLKQWGIATPGYKERKPPECYYMHAQQVDPRKRAGFLLRAVCDLWEQQGAQRAHELHYCATKSK